MLLVGSDAALLEGLTQSLAAVGRAPTVVTTLHEARETASASPPLIALVDRGLAAAAGAELLSIPLCPGGAIVLYRGMGASAHTLPHAFQRLVLADLTLPLERNRLVALVQHVEDRARVTGRSASPHPEARA